MSQGFASTLQINVSEPNERIAPICIAQHNRYGGESAMVWTGVSVEGQEDLHFIQHRTLTAERYCDDSLCTPLR